MAWTRVNLQVMTPLFNGGAGLGIVGEEEAGLRPASVRGVMRFWFRAMAGAVTGTDLSLLATLEHRVFGGVGSRGEDGTTVASPLILRIPSPPHPSRQLSLPHGLAAAHIAYLMGLGLMKPGGKVLERPCVAPGTPEFELMIKFQHRAGTPVAEREAVEALALVSLWLACTYGGFGARTHRGFGGVRITGVDGDLPAGWRSDWLKTPGVGVYDSSRRPWPWPWPVFGVYEQHLPELIRAVGQPAGPLDNWTTEPPFPVLSAAYSPAVLARPGPGKWFGSWQETLAFAGKQLRLFRANRPDTRRETGRVKTAEWADVSRIGGDDMDFPLGALGLPVIFRDKQSRDGFTVNAASSARPDVDELRRASPLWLRPVGSGDSWGLFTFAFRASFLPDTARVRVVPDKIARAHRHRTKTAWVEQDDVDALTGQWLETMRDGGDFTTILRD
jgi:CRISPR-associated protein Cmr1